MKNTFRKAALSTICMLVVAVMSLTGVTYAWFSQGTQAEVSNFTVNVQAASGNLMIGIADAGNIKWGNTITPFDNAQNSAGTLAPASTVGKVTGGAMEFFSAAIDESDTSKIKNVVAAGETTTVGETTYKNYVSFDFFIDNSTNSAALPVYLDGTSAVSGSTKSELASRIAIVPQSIVAASGNVVVPGSFAKSGTTSIIFEPNETTHTTSGQAYQAASNLGNTNAKYAYNGIKAAGATSGTSYGRYAANDVLGAVETLVIGDENPIVTVPANSYQMVTVYIWLEGQDADCLNDIAGAAFNVDLKLTLTQPGSEAVESTEATENT